MSLVLGFLSNMFLFSFFLVGGVLLLFEFLCSRILRFLYLFEGSSWFLARRLAREVSLPKKKQHL